MVAQSHRAQLHQRITAKVHEILGAGTRVLSIEPLAGDASSRRYYRVVLDPPARPESLIVMEWNDPGLPISTDELAVFDRPLQELPFLNVHRFLTRVGVRVPQVYGDWEAEGMLFLEDLGDISLWDRVQRLPHHEVLGWYSKAIDELLTMQVAGTRARDASCIAFQQRFDTRLYLWEFEHFIEYGIERGGERTLPDRERRKLTDAFVDITGRLTQEPAILNHRDYHSWNLMISGEEVVVIDFQDALLAPAAYDLASLLNDRETDSVITPLLEQTLVDSYLGKRELLGEAAVRRDAFWETYLLSVLQRDFKVVGRFYYLDLVKGKPGYKRFIAPTLKRIVRNLGRVPSLDSLVPLITKHFEGLA